jgi:hypothetical protein
MLGCPSTEVKCVVKLTLRGPKRRVLGVSAGALPGDGLGVFRIHLREGTVPAVRKAHLLPAVLTANVTDGAGNRAKRLWNVRLKIAKPPRAVPGADAASH